MTQIYDVLELFLSKKDIQYTSQHLILLTYAIELALNNLSLFLMFIFHLKQLCWSIFVLPP